MSEVVLAEERENAKRRKLKWYQTFRSFSEFVASKPEPAELVLRVYDLLDSWYAFGSMGNASSAKASMELALKDVGLVK